MYVRACVCACVRACVRVGTAGRGGGAAQVEEAVKLARREELLRVQAQEIILLHLILCKNLYHDI